MVRRFRAESALTLIEIMVVLIIIGIVMTFLGQKILGAGDKAKANLTKIRLQEIQQAIEQYRLEYNALPKSLFDLTSCNDQTGPGCIPPMTEEQMVDAWDNELDFKLGNGGRTYTILSYGADGKPGGIEVDFDVNLKGP